MESEYQCVININFKGGDIQFDVSSETQLFSFKSGIGFVTIPYYFSTLLRLYRREINEAKLDCHGNADYYKFSSDGITLIIEYITDSPKEEIYKYQFNLEKYLKAVEGGFLKYLRQLEKEGILPLKTQEYAHPLGDDVLNAFYDFSTILRS